MYVCMCVCIFVATGSTAGKKEETKNTCGLKPQFPQIAKGLCYHACFGNLYFDLTVWTSEGDPYCDINYMTSWTFMRGPHH